MSNFSKDQLNRYEMYRRSALPKSAVRKVRRMSADKIFLKGGVARKKMIFSCLNDLMMIFYEYVKNQQKI